MEQKGNMYMDAYLVRKMEERHVHIEQKGKKGIFSWYRKGGRNDCAEEC